MDKRRVLIVGGASLSAAATIAAIKASELPANWYSEVPKHQPVRIHTGPKSALSPRQARKARKAEAKQRAQAAQGDRHE